MSDLTSASAHTYPLAEALATLRTELKAAMKAAQDDPDLKLDVDEAEVVLNVAFTRETGGSGKLTAWVIELGGSAKASVVDTHTFRIRMTPRSGAGGRVAVSDTSGSLPTGALD